MKRSAIALIVLCTLLASTSAWAWMFSGHMLTGAIAYDVLKKDNPQALAAVIAVLKQHPQFDKMWAKQLAKVDEADRDQALFMLAARWPDDIRGESDYDHPTWHYIDYPFKPAGQSEEVETEQPADQNIETAFRTNVEIVKSDATDAEKAIAVCWILHLLGDGHQPLHAVSLFSKDYPKGDQGGNKEFIRVKPDGKPLKLHRFWDGVVSGSEDTRDLHKIAIELRHNYPREQLDPHPESVSPANFADWIQESAELARTKVYLNGQLAASPDRDNAPALPDEYVQQAKILGEQRVTLAGYRIADILAKLFQ